MTQLENNLAFRLNLSENKIAISKISIYFLSPIAFRTYQNQYRSKYSIFSLLLPLRLTKVNTEVNTVLGLPKALSKARILNFPLSRTYTISDFFAGPVGVRDTGCPL